MASWLTLDEARDWWRDAPADDEYLEMILYAAASQVTAYGPDKVAESIANTGVVPGNYRLAQLEQTRNIWNAIKQDVSTGGIGDEGFLFRPYPLDGNVKQIIRPQRAKPVVR